MAAEDSSRLHTAVLTGDNYISWALKMEGYFLSRGWWDVVSVPRAALSEEQQVIDRRARSAILLQVDDVHVLHLRGAATARECWVRLRELFVQDSPITRVQLTRELYQMKYKPGQCMQSYLTQMNTMFEKLDQSGRTLPNFEKVQILLNSLDSSFDVLITTMEGMQQEQLNWRYVTGRLIEEIRRRELSLGKADSSGGSKGKHRGRDGGGGEEEAGVSAMTVRKCFSCGSTRHLKRNCPKEREKKQQKDTSSQKPRKKWMEKYAAVVTREEADNDEPVWILDSGAADNIANRKECFKSLMTNPSEVLLANGVKAPCLGAGDVRIPALGVVCAKVLFVPSLEYCLLSVARLLQQKYSVMFQEGKGVVLKDDVVVAIAKQKDGLFIVQPAEQPGAKVVATAVNPPLHHQCLHLMHRRMGHANFRAVAKTLELTDYKVHGCQRYLDCKVCKAIKTKRYPVSKRSDRHTEVPFALIHADLVGPLPTKSIGGAKYFLTLVDDHTRYSWVHVLKHKSQAFEKFKNWYAWIERQFEPQVKAIQTDRGGEFLSDQFQSWLRKKGIEHRKTNPYTPAENGIAERHNGVVQNMMQCMINDAGVSMSLWAEAVATANHVINRVWNSVIDDIPYKLLYKRSPKVSYFRTFGSYAWVNIPSVQRRKGDVPTQKLRFLGYESFAKSYRFLAPHGKVVVSRSATFAEGNWDKIHTNPEMLLTPSSGDEVERDSDSDSDSSRSPSRSPIHGRNGGALKKSPQSPRKSCKKEQVSPRALEHVQSAQSSATDSEQGSSDAEGEEASPVPRRSQRKTKGIPPKRFETVRVCQVSLEPKSFEDLASLPQAEAKKWEEAMNEEMKSMEELNVFTRVKLPANKKAVGSRWVFRKKNLPDGSEQYKARLVAQGFTQRKD